MFRTDFALRPEELAVVRIGPCGGLTSFVLLFIEEKYFGIVVEDCYNFYVQHFDLGGI